ncbi:MAG: YfhO family protein, partial [Oscillospiraceae bacterium]|nr:YfhO family protein [Oscillospiraceae bacterium]
AALCVFLFVSFDVNVLNFIWHGFHTQNGLPNRFSFIYIAVLLVMAHQSLWHVRHLGWGRIFASILIPLGFTGYAWWSNLGEREFYVYLSTEILLTLYGLILILWGTAKRRRERFQKIIVGVGMVEMIATGVYGVCMNGTVSRQTYLNDQIAYGKLMERNETGDEYFRSDIDSTRMRNVDMFMGADGIMLFSSTMPASTVDLSKAIGMEARTNKSGYVGVTKLFNDIFGVRYVESRTDTERLYQMEKVDYEEPLSLYKNENALSIGFMVDSDIKEWDIDSGSHMDVQNQFTALAVDEGPLYSLNQTFEMSDGGTYDIVIPAGMQAYLDVTKKVKKVSITTPDYVKS